MRLAIEWSRKGMENGNLGPIGAVVVRDGQVLGQGHNRCQADLDITAHGEMVAIRDGIKNTGCLDGLKGATLYTTAQPCPMCYTACHWAGIERIVYSLSCQDTYAIGAEFGFNDAALYADLQRPEQQTSNSPGATPARGGPAGPLALVTRGLFLRGQDWRTERSGNAS